MTDFVFRHGTRHFLINSVVLLLSYAPTYYNNYIQLAVYQL